MIDVAGRRIGRGARVFVIAEAGVNHNGDLELARQLVDSAAAAGADAVKFQTFRADRVASAEAPKAAYQLATTDRDQTQLDLLRGLELSAPRHRELQARCADRGVLFLSTPFDVPSVGLLAELGLPAIKVPSGELTNRLLLDAVAATRKPVLLSTGMAYLEEIQEAIDVLRGGGVTELALLHCVTDYPADPGDVNLSAIATLEEAFKMPVGLSDHTIGTAIPIAAVALGACIIEKHFTMSRQLPGPDHAASLEPTELTQMIRDIRDVERARGTGRKEPAPSETANRGIVRRSLAAGCRIAAGEQITREMLDALRPATGISPMQVDAVIGRRAARDLPAGQLLAWSDLT
jgi:N,N'-diacetyllegionaminate synthase